MHFRESQQLEVSLCPMVQRDIARGCESPQYLVPLFHGTGCGQGEVLRVHRVPLSIGQVMYIAAMGHLWKSTVQSPCPMEGKIGLTL